MRKKLCFYFLIWSFCLPVRATNYYFSESIGNDAWSGRLPSPNANNTDGPKKSIISFNNLINSQSKAGDSLFFRRNDLWTGSQGMLINSAQGTSQQHIFIGAYGIGPKPQINKTGNGEIILCRGSANSATAYLLIKDLALSSNSPAGNRPVGVYINEGFYPNKPHHIILDQLDITGCQNGMVLYQHNIIIRNCVLKNNGNNSEGQGIFCSADSVQMLNNIFDGNGNGSVFVHSIYISQCSNVLFEGNEIKNADDGLKLRASENLIIRNNRIHDTYIHTLHLGGDDGSGTKNVIIEGNIIYDAPQGLRISSESGTQTQLSENIIIRNNIFPAQVFISNNGPIKDIYFYNNLIYSSNNQAALFFTNALNPVNLQVKNNIFYKTTENVNHSLVNISSTSGLNGINLDHNLYYFPESSGNLLTVGSLDYKSLSQFSARFPDQEQHGQNGNPFFVNPYIDFHLSSQSLQAIDKGENLINLVDFDLDGIPRPIDGAGVGVPRWDIGPYEYCCLVDQQDIEGNSSYIKLYPNPFRDQLNIMTNYSDILDFKIRELSGKLIFESKFTPHQQQVNLSILPEGFYFIEVSNDILKSQVYKICKM